MGRPRKDLTSDQVDQVERLAAVLTMEQIADFLGMHEATLRRRMKDDPRVSRAYKIGKARAISEVAQTLVQQALHGNTTAAIFFLKTQAGWRERDRPEDEARGQLDAIADALQATTDRPVN